MLCASIARELSPVVVIFPVFWTVTEPPFPAPLPLPPNDHVPPEAPPLPPPPPMLCARIAAALPLCVRSVPLFETVTLPPLPAALPEPPKLYTPPEPAPLPPP